MKRTIPFALLGAACIATAPLAAQITPTPPDTIPPIPQDTMTRGGGKSDSVKHHGMFKIKKGDRLFKRDTLLLPGRPGSIGAGAIVNTDPPVVNPTPPTKATRETPKRPSGVGAREGLTNVQLLALQQQLRDEGCGVESVTGVLDGQTRRAIAKCKKKYGVTGNGRDLLAAMNIGFPADMQDTGMGSIMRKPQQ